MSSINSWKLFQTKFFEALSDSSKIGAIQAKLAEKMAIVENIQQESLKIAALKKKNGLSEGSKTELKKMEELLTLVVSRVVEQEDRSRDLLQKQGFRISRR